MAQLTVIITLPLNYNPDEEGNCEPIEDEKFMETMEEIAHKFEGGTLHICRDESRPVETRGVWWSKGVVYHDELVLMDVVVKDTPDNRAWLRTYAKDVLAERFDQEAICIRFISQTEMLIVKRKET